MCSITGLLDKQGQEVANNLKHMLQQTSYRGPDGCGIYVNDILEKGVYLDDLRTEGMHGASGLGHSRLGITGSAGTQPLCSCDRRFILAFNGEIWNYKSLRSELALLGHSFESDSDGEVIIHLVEENHKKSPHLIKSVSQTCKKLDGEYAFAVLDKVTRTITLTRDPVGVKQLYYGQNYKYLAFCSEKKPLWDIGIIPQRVQPGEIVETSFDEKFQYHFFGKYQNVALTMPPFDLRAEREALARYKQALFNSVKKRTEGREKVGIIFSGGVDSVLIAQIAKSLSCNISCYASGFENSEDVIAARQASEELGMELRIHELNEQELEAELENIILAIESSNHLQVDVAIPIFFAVKEAKKERMRVMLTGQGADEIFAGYEWYPKIYRERGDEALKECLWNDIKNVHKDTLEREDKISMYHSIELRVPYLDPEVIEVAMAIPGDLKIKNNHVKYLHRKLAEDIGVPKHLAWRKKKAAQHGSDVHDNLTKILKRMSKKVENCNSFNNDEETLGSAYRYNHAVYKKNKSIQRTLDAIGKKVGIYTKIT